jgi:hypothetical protein
MCSKTASVFILWHFDVLYSTDILTLILLSDIILKHELEERRMIWDPNLGQMQCVCYFFLLCNQCVPLCREQPVC